MKRWSPTGCVFSVVFFGVAIWCLVSSTHGDGGPLWLFSFLTLPMSFLLVFPAYFAESHLGWSADVLGWVVTVLDVFWGMLMFYFFGWLLERPLRR